MILHIFCVVQALDVDTGAHFVFFLDIDHVLDCAALRLLVTFRQLVNLQPVQTTHLREEHHRRVHRSLIYFLDKVCVASRTGFRTDTATRLLTELGQRSTLDITEVRDGDNHIVIGVHIFRIELSCHLHDLRATLVGILIFDLQQLVVDHIITHHFVSQQLVQMRNQFLQLLILVLQLINTQACQCAQTHIDDSFRLQVIQVEACFEIGLRIGRSATCANDTNHFVDIIHSDNQAFQDMRTLFGLTQLVARTTCHHIHSVVHKVTNQVFQVQQHRTAVNQRDIIYAERRLQLRELI